MLFKCWASVEDGGPTFKQHWVNASCLLGGGRRGHPLAATSAKLLVYQLRLQIVRVVYTKIQIMLILS